MRKKTVRESRKVPEGMGVQLSRLFGTDSSEARLENRSDKQWKRTLLNVLQELDRYLAANVETDEVHRLMLHSGLYAAHMSLEEQDFWTGYVEGITRLALILMGDYPDHRKRKGGGKKKEFYQLNRLRSLTYNSSPSQRVNVLFAAPLVGISLTVAPRDALAQFRSEFGYEVGYNRFFEWYRKNYPLDYAAVF